MDRKVQHHQHHEKEREHKKQEHKQHEHEQEKSTLPVHPVWLCVIGVALIAAAVLVWTFLLP